MKTDLYTKIILTALTISVFALVYQQSGADGLSPISVAEAKGKASKAKVYNWLYQEVELKGEVIKEGVRTRPKASSGECACELNSAC